MRSEGRRVVARRADIVAAVVYKATTGCARVGLLGNNTVGLACCLDVSDVASVAYMLAIA